jgi:hypothetical protein
VKTLNPQAKLDEEQVGLFLDELLATFPGEVSQGGLTLMGLSKLYAQGYADLDQDHALLKALQAAAEHAAHPVGGLIPAKAARQPLQEVANTQIPLNGTCIADVEKSEDAKEGETGAGSVLAGAGALLSSALVAITPLFRSGASASASPNAPQIALGEIGATPLTVARAADIFDFIQTPQTVGAFAGKNAQDEGATPIFNLEVFAGIPTPVPSANGLAEALAAASLDGVRQHAGSMNSSGRGSMAAGGTGPGSSQGGSRYVPSFPISDDGSDASPLAGGFQAGRQSALAGGQCLAFAVRLPLIRSTHQLVDTGKDDELLATIRQALPGERRKIKYNRD